MTGLLKSAAQLIPSSPQHLYGHFRKALQNEQHPLRVRIKPGAGALTPVPASASRTLIIAPNALF